MPAYMPNAPELTLKSRNEAIYARRLTGATLGAIGREFNLSRETVRLIALREERRARAKRLAPLRDAFARAGNHS
jgi:DNA-directed RNA polymerase sigma subunit (sigma70/sigma32)